jgi:flavin-dependent dehydrogenase
MKIVIVGGGTAGWLAALMISKVHTGHDITVIESSKINIVGAGEGSTGFLTDIVQNSSWNYGCNEKDFFQETNATVKLGIRHKDWKSLGESYVAPLDAPLRNREGTDYLLLYTILNDIPFHLSSENGKYIEKSLSSFYRNNEGKIADNQRHAYHFDAKLVGQYFKKVCGNSVKNIDAIVEKLNFSENGNVVSLLLDNGETIYGDFFVDASGFSRLFAKEMDLNWKSYKDNLPLNTAMPFFLPLPEKIDPVTTAWAQKNGWMWMIPTQERLGCGYVFDDRFVSQEDAHKEIEKSLGVEVEPIKFLKFDAGRLEKVWHKNVLFVGLSAAFAEPLEATSIHTTILQLYSFIFEYLKDTVEETCNFGSINIYNRRMTKVYDDMMNFLNIHYVGGRSDSEFWKWVSTKEIFTESTKNFLEMQKHKLISPSDIDPYYGNAGSGLYNWIMSGLDIINKKLAEKEMKFFNQEELALETWQNNKRDIQIFESYIIPNTDFIKNVKKYSQWQ